MRVNLSTLVERPPFLPEFSEWGKLQEKRIAVTGHRGILGSLLMQRFQKANVSVEAFPGDITDSAAISAWIKSTRPDAIFHLAAIVPLRKVETNPVAAMRVNATALLDIFEAIGKFTPQCWFFLSSTSHVYDTFQGWDDRQCIRESSATDPISLYGATKLAAERITAPLATHFGTSLCVGRIFSYFHEQQPQSFLIPNLVQRVQNARNGAVIEVCDSDSVRDFLYAEMVVDALLFLCARCSSEIVNIGSGQAKTVGAMAESVIAKLQKNISVQHVTSLRPTRLVADIDRLKSIIKLSEDK